MEQINVVYNDVEYTLCNVFVNGKVTPCAITALNEDESLIKVKQVASVTIKELSDAVKKEAKQARIKYMMLNDRTTEEASSLLSKESKLKDVVNSLSYCKTVIVL